MRTRWCNLVSRLKEGPSGPYEAQFESLKNSWSNLVLSHSDLLR